MLTSGDVADLDLRIPEGHDAGFRHPVVVVTAQRILDQSPTVIHVVPLTSTLRRFESEVRIEPDDSNGLDRMSAAQSQHVRSVSSGRVRATKGNVGPAILTQIREALAVLFDLP